MISYTMQEEFINQQTEKRKFIRHPVEVPIEYKISGQEKNLTESTKDISFGGIRFQTRHYIEPGTLLLLKFPTIHPDVELRAIVVWCNEEKEFEEIGVEFLDENEAYRARTIEEICYKRQNGLSSGQQNSLNEFG
ncbi:MAG: PilZ domain-containing protein [Calditrichaeota bacterium]|nr:PilZ domain-containing protein [Calditrichota bacterium]